jgi:hypothetical protein
LEGEYEFIIAENCPHCPRLLSKNNSGGVCDGDSGIDNDARTPLDQALASITMLLYKLAMVNVTGILSLSRFAKISFIDNAFLSEHFLSGLLPIKSSCHHPAWNTRKVPGLLAMVSGSTPTTSTRAKSSKGGQSGSKSSNLTGRNEEMMLVYKLIEPYFVALKTLTGSGTPLAHLFRVLENSDFYRPMFTLEYASLCLDPKYASITAEVAELFNNKKSITAALKKVFSSCLNLFDRSSPLSHPRKLVSKRKEYHLRMLRQFSLDQDFCCQNGIPRMIGFQCLMAKKCPRSRLGSIEHHQRI